MLRRQREGLGSNEAWSKGAHILKQFIGQFRKGNGYESSKSAMKTFAGVPKILGAKFFTCLRPFIGRPGRGVGGTRQLALPSGPANRCVCVRVPECMCVCNQSILERTTSG